MTPTEDGLDDVDLVLNDPDSRIEDFVNLVYSSENSEDEE